MSWVFSVILASAPLFSWADSLYLDPVRLGMVEYYAEEGREAHFIYSNVAVYENNSASGWKMGLCSVPLIVQPQIDAILNDSKIDSEESADLEKLAIYIVGPGSYPLQQYKGPWDEIEALLAGLRPKYTVQVREGGEGAGSRAVCGTLYVGDDFRFQSAAGDYRTEAPQPAQGIKEYLEENHLDTEISGILYLQGDFPLFFYPVEGVRG